MDELFKAVKTLLAASSSFLASFQNTLASGEVVELTPVPNWMIRPVGEAKKTQSNKSLYELFGFDLEIADDNWERLGGLKRTANGLLRYADLNAILAAQSSPYELKVIRSPTVVYLWENRYYKCVLTYEAEVASSVRPHGG